MNVNTLPRRRFQRTSAEGGGGGGQGQNGESQNNQQQNNQQQNNQQQQNKPFVPIATQEEFNTRIQERIDRAVAKFSDYDKLKAEADEFVQWKKEHGTDQEKAVIKAREEERTVVLARTIPQTVRQAFRAEAKGVLTEVQLSSLLEDLDLTKYADKNGDPDEEKIGKKVAAFAPAEGSGNGKGAGRGFGQGQGHQASTVRKGEAGVAEAERRFGKATVKVP
jgi:hypothetical protein